MHQEQNRSYKEICTPIMERCCFLINELRPTRVSNILLDGYRKSMLKSESRWQKALSQIINTVRTETGK